MTKEELIKLLQDSNLWNRETPTDGEKLHLVYELAQCAGDLVSAMSGNDKLGDKLFKNTVEIADLVENYFEGGEQTDEIS